MDLRAHATFRLMAGRPLPLAGRLLADTRDGKVVPLDPDTGGALDLSGRSDLLPAFILSTEGEATDGHIVRQFWDLSRSQDVGGPGIPALYNHSMTHVGQWHDLGVRDLGDLGRGLVGRPRLMDFGESARLELGRQIREGFLRSVSVGWNPGESVRRGELDPADPLYREPIDGPCGPEEGMIMGTEASPNRLFETSFTPLPADMHAQQMAEQRLLARAGSALARISEGGTATRADLSALLAVLGADESVERWARSLVEKILTERGTVRRDPPPPALPDEGQPPPPRMWWQNNSPSQEDT